MDLREYCVVGLLLLGWVASRASLAGDAPDPLKVSVDPKLVGVWQTVAQTYAGQVTYSLEISDDGGYRLTPSSGLAGEAGIFESGGGRWSMTSSAARHDAGTYAPLAEDRIRMTSPNGAVEWTRSSKQTKPNPPAQSKSPEGIPVLALHGVGVSAEANFDSLRATADVIARAWDARAALCRADVVGSYSRSVARFSSIRLVYFRPDDFKRGFELVYDPSVDAGRLHGTVYPFTEAQGISAAPARVLDPKECFGDCGAGAERTARQSLPATDQGWRGAAADC